MQIIESLRRKVRRRLGRTASASVLDSCIQAFALFQQALTTGPIKAAEQYLQEPEIIRGSEIARSMMRIASKTYEGRVITTGILVCPPDRCVDIIKGETRDAHHLKFLTFKPPLDLDWNTVEAIVPFAQLADGKNSVLLCDTAGKIYAVLDIENYLLVGLAWLHGGYAFTCTKNKEVFLFYPWGHAEDPVAAYDGYEWSYCRESMSIITGWLHDQDLKAGRFQWLHIIGGNIEPGVSNFKAQSLMSVIEHVIQLRLSTIIVLCEKAAFKKLKHERLLTSLRPELDAVIWEHFKEFSLKHVPLLRLDGAHVISANLKILAVAQQISTESSPSKPLAGTGRAAAQYLSKRLGTAGIVIKVSSDGPVSVFLDGQQPNEYISTIDHRALISKKEGKYPGIEVKQPSHATLEKEETSPSPPQEASEVE